jgi:hypothetical protein
MSSSRTRYLELVNVFSINRCRSLRDRRCNRGLLEGRHTGSLNVSDDASGLVVHELNADLGNTAAGAWRSQNLFVAFAALVP